MREPVGGTNRPRPYSSYRRLAQYCARPPFALEHLHPRDADHVIYRNPKPVRTTEQGTRPAALVLTPLELIGRIAALVMDVNCPWSVAQALAVADEVRASDLLWFEEPVWPPEDFAGLAEVRKRGGIKTAAGENCISAQHFDYMLRAGAVDYAQPSVTKIGGITEFLKVMQITAQHGATLMPHSPYFGPGLLATVHLLSTLPIETMVEYSFTDLGTNPLGDAIAMVNGRIAVPQGPGLGADPDLRIVEQYRVK